MQQLDIDFEPPPMAQARAVGQVAAEFAEQRAEKLLPGFSARARVHIMDQLDARGEASGEALTESCESAGIKASDRRAFGGIFASLVRDGLIVSVRADLPRARGHGTSGGRLWRRAR